MSNQSTLKATVAQTVSELCVNGKAADIAKVGIKIGLLINFYDDKHAVFPSYNTENERSHNLQDFTQ